jgi:hypothetical protein
MSKRVYPSQRIRMTDTELEASRQHWNEREELERRSELQRLSGQPDHAKTEVTSTRQTKPTPRTMREGTIKAIQAVAAVIYDDRPFPTEARAMARRAADVASKLGLTDPDGALNPDGRTLRDVAQAALDGIKATHRT